MAASRDGQGPAGGSEAVHFAWGTALRDDSKIEARFALKAVAFATVCLCASQASALGLGRLNVQSTLGEALKAEIEVTSLTAEEASSLKLRVAPPEAYRAAGVEYNAALPSAQVQVVRKPDGRNVLRVTSERAVLEPFVDVIIEANWSNGKLVREYTMLFDPPAAIRTAQPPQARP
jgi:pilus assembly protein FimV